MTDRAPETTAGDPCRHPLGQVANAVESQAVVERRLQALANSPAAAEQRMVTLVREWLCPCLVDRTCRWPACAKTGNGIGHYP